MRLSGAGSPAQTAALVRMMARTVLSSPGGGLQKDGADRGSMGELSRIRDYLKGGAPATPAQQPHLQARASGAAASRAPLFSARH